MHRSVRLRVADLDAGTTPWNPSAFISRSAVQRATWTPSRVQRTPHLAGPHQSVVVCMRPLNLCRQLRIPDRPVTGWASLGRIVRARAERLATSYTQSQQAKRIAAALLTAEGRRRRQRSSQSVSRTRSLAISHAATARTGGLADCAAASLRRDVAGRAWRWARQVRAGPQLLIISKRLDCFTDACVEDTYYLWMSISLPTFV
jgi:hypothetical protein